MTIKHVASDVDAKTFELAQKDKSVNRKIQNTRTQSLLGKDPVTMTCFYV